MNNSEAILVNPIWSALASDQITLGSGTNKVRIFDPEIAPFAGLEAYTPENFQMLFNSVEDGRVVVLFSANPELNPSPFEIVNKMPGYQMIFEGEVPLVSGQNDLFQLTENNVPAMLSLTQLAQPGPFLKRTISFGGYRGVFVNDQLVAMGGHRLQASGYTEISAVCTHPNYSGKGFGRDIMNAVVRDIMAANRVPYLHVRADNTRAIDLYKRLGFVICRSMNFYVVKKPMKRS